MAFDFGLHGLGFLLCRSRCDRQGLQSTGLPLRIAQGLQTDHQNIEGVAAVSPLTYYRRDIDLNSFVQFSESFGSPAFGN